MTFTPLRHSISGTSVRYPHGVTGNAQGGHGSGSTRKRRGLFHTFGSMASSAYFKAGEVGTMQTSMENKPITWSRIVSIADNEARKREIQDDIEHGNLPRHSLWVCAFRLGYRMGQLRLTDSKDLP